MSRTTDLKMSNVLTAMATDATAAAQLLGLDGYEAARINFRMIASHVADTETVVQSIQSALQN